MLLGAVFKHKEMNPVDYIYHALNIIIESVDDHSPEYDVINTYITNTGGGSD
jgi:hypothetical protein